MGRAAGGALSAHQAFPASEPAGKVTAFKSATYPAHRFDALYGTIGHGVMVHTPDGLMVYANPAAAELLGAPAAELVRRSAGYSFWSAVDSGGRPVSRAEHPTWRALATARAVPATLIRIDSAAGQQIWMSVSATPLKEPDGTVSGVLTMFQDVTSKHRGASSRARPGAVQELAESLGGSIRATCGIFLARAESTRLELAGLHGMGPVSAGAEPVSGEADEAPSLDSPGLRELLSSGRPAISTGETGIVDGLRWAELIGLPPGSGLIILPIGGAHPFGLAVLGRAPGEAPLEEADSKALMDILHPAQASLAAGRTEAAAARRLRRLRALVSLERAVDGEPSPASRMEKVLSLLASELGLREADAWAAGPDGEMTRIAATGVPAGGPNLAAGRHRLEDLLGTQRPDFRGVPVRWAGAVVGVAGLGVPPGAMPDEEWWDFAELAVARLGPDLSPIGRGLDGSHSTAPGASLSGSESRVYDLLRRGLTNGEIAHALFLSENTIKFHVSRIFRKLGVRNRVEAVRLGPQP